jgi:glyoxylase-like metal-dependent hydrolase (beta-lactamase superfamily II)
MSSSSSHRATPARQGTGSTAGQDGAGWAPVPESSRGPVIPPQGYFVEEIRERFYWVTEGMYQCGFVVTGEGVIAIDAPPSIGDRVMKAIRSVTDEPVTHVVYSHSHGDHIGAADQFPDSAVRIGHLETGKWLDRLRDLKRKPPDIVFNDSYVLEVGDQALQLDYRGGNHAAGNIFIYAPRQRVLMIVDVFYPGWVPFAGLGLCRDIPGFVDHHDYALEYEFDTLIGGHLTRLGSREDVQTQREYVHDLRREALRALKEVDQLPSWKYVDNVYGMFTHHFNRIAAAAAEELLPKWTGKLAGVDFFAHNHAFIMLEALRVDWNAEPAVILPPPSLIAEDRRSTMP